MLNTNIFFYRARWSETVNCCDWSVWRGRRKGDPNQRCAEKRPGRPFSSAPRWVSIPWYPMRFHRSDIPPMFTVTSRRVFKTVSEQVVYPISQCILSHPDFSLSNSFNLPNSIFFNLSWFIYVFGSLAQCYEETWSVSWRSGAPWDTSSPREAGQWTLFFVAMGSLVVKSKQMIYLMWVKQETPTHLGMVYTTYLYLFMVILGMVYSCFTHIIPIGHGHIIAMRVSWGPRQSVLRRSESMRSQGGPGR